MDAIAADTVFRVDAHVQRKQRHDDARQHARRRYHEHDYHLQSCRLAHVRTAQDRARHHTWDGDNAHYAKGKGDKRAQSASEWDALVAYLIWLIVGIRARRRDSIASGRQASKRDAPKASSVSVLSWFSLQYSVESTTCSLGR
jgi:hypothetical protein